MQPEDLLPYLKQECPLQTRGFCNQRGQGPAAIDGIEVTPIFQVHEEWSINLYTCRGSIFMPDYDRGYDFAPGHFILMPPKTRRQFTFTSPGIQMVVHFHPKLPLETEQTYHGDLGQHFQQAWFLGESVLGSQRQDMRPAIMWHLLEHLTEYGAQPQHALTRQQVYQQALTIIQRRLTEVITVPEIAAAVDVSVNTLIRIFQDFRQQTVVATIRSLRLEAARELLWTTDMPIKDVAQSVGIADVQYFNKCIRHEFGRAPRALRSSRQASANI